MKAVFNRNVFEVHQFSLESPLYNKEKDTFWDIPVGWTNRYPQLRLWNCGEEIVCEGDYVGLDITNRKFLIKADDFEILCSVLF